MLKHSLVSAAALSLMTAPAFAQAAPQPVELEGLFQSYNSGTRTMLVMGMQVFVPPTAIVRSATTTMTEAGYNLHTWMRDVLPGRTRQGFTGGTAKLTGTWDPVARRIVATDVLVEPAENVALGVVTASLCTTPNCDGPSDYIRGGTKIDGSPGPAMIPILDPRIPASPVKDETGFKLNLTGADLRNEGYAAEGYFGDVAVTVPGPSGSVSERSFHYFILDLINPSPHLFANKDQREVSVLRTRCNVGDRWEIRGHVHTRVNAQGVDNDSINANSGVISIQYTNASGQLVRVNGGAATPLPGYGAIGAFRVRLNTNFCPETYSIRWLPTANSNNSQAYASLENIGIDRLREGAPEDN